MTSIKKWTVGLITLTVTLVLISAPGGATNKDGCLSQALKSIRYLVNTLKKPVRHFGDITGAYWIEVKETRGLRLLLAPWDPTKAGLRTHSGFLVEIPSPKPPSWFFSPLKHLSWQMQGRGMQFKKPALLGGLNHTLVRRPMSWVIQTANRVALENGWEWKNEKISKLLGAPVKAATLAALPVGTVAFVYVYEYLDDEYKDAVAAERAELISQYQSFWDALRKNDFRYDIDSSHPNPNIEAYLRHEALTDYYAYMEQSYPFESPEERQKMLLEDPLVGILFSHINRLIETRPIRTSRREKARLRSELLEMEHEYFRRVALIHALEEDPTQIESMLRYPELKRSYDTLLAMPIYKDLSKQHAAGQISTTEFRKFFSEHNFMETRIRELEHSGHSIPNQIHELRQLSVFEDERADHAKLLRNVGSDLAILHVLRRLHPYFRQYRNINLAAYALRTGAKKAVREGVRLEQVKHPASSVALSVFRWVGNTIIFADIAGRTYIWITLDDEIQPEPLVPFQGLAE